MKSIVQVFLLSVLLMSADPVNDQSQQLNAPAASNYPSHQLTVPSLASSINKDDVVIRDAWMQEGPPSQTITAAYMVIENHTAADLSLLSATSEVAESVELHKMELANGFMKMHRVEAIDIPAGGKVELKSGSYHLMIIGLKRILKDGDMVSITLQFNNDIRKTIKIPVKPRSAMVKED